MAVEQKNVGLFTYVDGAGKSWNKRGEKEAVRQAVDGSTAPGDNPNWGRETRRHSVRKVIYQDPTTFRTKTVIFYTAAAWAAIGIGTSTLTFMIEGSATGVVYTAVKQVPERLPGASAPRNLAEHA